jgi:RNA polymerase sigma-70 factor (ECF subfamily)
MAKVYESYNNHELLELLSSSDERAFTEIYNRFWKKLFGVAFNRLKETEEAEDIVHDVFASLWANRNKAEITSLDNYLASVAKYMVLDKIKKKERARMYKNSSNQSELHETPVETSLHYKFILGFVKDEIEKLPEKCTLIFKYSRYEGMSTKQIAEELNISPKTVENQLNKALRQLKLVAKTFASLVIAVFGGF